VATLTTTVKKVILIHVAFQIAQISIKINLFSQILNIPPTLGSEILGGALIMGHL